MSTTPSAPKAARLLDLFCCEGGAATGYARAGFEVVGIDIEPQPRYPFEFHRADAVTFPLDGFDVLHASPPCQSYSRALRHLATPQPMLIDIIRERFQASGRPWVIENVPGAPLNTSSDLFGNHGTQLCGTSFGLAVHRHRLFECSESLPQLPCAHKGHAMNPHQAEGRERIYAKYGRQDPEKLWAKEMGVAWMSRHGARECVPPAYTEWIGRQLLASLPMAA